MLNVNKHAQVSESKGFQRMFAPNRLTVGVFFPIESFERDQPTMLNQEKLAGRAEALGFSAVWVRDVPLRDPDFGDIGQVYDPWVFLAWIAAQTRSIALATGAIVLPLRHPIHTAKAAASVDQLSGGRLVMGVASGDRPIEFPAFGVNMENRGHLFRENMRVIREVLSNEFPVIESDYVGLLGNADVVPKPVGRLPMLVAGGSRQSVEWVAANSDGWITYPRNLQHQGALVEKWRALVATTTPGVFKPFAQSLYIDLADDPDQPPEPIHLGFRAGRNVFYQFLDSLRSIGVNHVGLNLKYSRREAGDVLQEIGEEVLPQLERSQTSISSKLPHADNRQPSTDDNGRADHSEAIRFSEQQANMEQL